MERTEENNTKQIREMFRIRNLDIPRNISGTTDTVLTEKQRHKNDISNVTAIPASNGGTFTARGQQQIAPGTVIAPSLPSRIEE